MFTQASIHAFDMLGYVHTTAEVRQTEHPGESPAEIVLHVSTTEYGNGENDAREWLRDALIALLESL